MSRSAMSPSAAYPDPRVSVVDAGTTGADAATEIFQALKYPAIDSPIPVARWEEAQLILAEADVAAGDVGGAVGIINTLHANAGIPAYRRRDAGRGQGPGHRGAAPGAVPGGPAAGRHHPVWSAALSRAGHPVPGRRDRPPASTGPRSASRCQRWSATTTRTSAAETRGHARCALPPARARYGDGSRARRTSVLALPAAAQGVERAARRLRRVRVPGRQGLGRPRAWPWPW